MTETLASVEELIAAGRLLDALDLLERVGNTANDRAIDRRLVELRHEAFAALDRSPGRPEWPPIYPDLFRTVEGIPEVRAEELSTEVIGGAVTHHGCLRVNGFVDAQTVEWFRTCIDDAFAARDRRKDSDIEERESIFEPFGVGQKKADGFGSGAFVRTADVPVAMRRLVQLFDTTGLRSAVTGYFGERPAMIANKWVLRRSPSGKAGTDYHQDGAFLGDGIRTLDCWIALSDCGPGTGRPAMDLLPRRFAVLDEDPQAAFSWSLSEGAVHAAMPDAPVVSPTFRAGDALIFDERLPHRTSVGLELSERYAIESWFVAPSCYPDKHVPFVL